MEQMIASLGFQFKKVQQFRGQSIWKSIFYVVVAILLANSIVYGVKWLNQPTFDEALPSFQVTEQGLTYEEPFVFDMPVLDLVVMVGEERSTNAKQTLLLEEEGWVFKRSGITTELNSYETLLRFVNQERLTEAGVRDVVSDLNWFYPLYIYGAVLLDLLVHVVLITLLALAGLSFRRFVPIRFKEAWTITAYGITAPLIVRTVISLLPITVQMLPVLYWATVGIFAFMTIRKIGDE